MTVNKQGRITLPIEARRRLDLCEGRQLEVDVDEREIRLRPLVAVPIEDAWLYTRENVASIRRSLAHIAAGRTFTASAGQLEQRVRERLRARKGPRRR